MSIEHRIIQDVVDARARLAPAAEAVIDGEVRLSNSDLSERIDAVARFLLAHGISKGDRVAMLAPPSADFWIVFLATASIGAIWQGLNPRYQRNEYAYLLGDAAPKLVFVRSPFEGRAYLDELRDLAAAGTIFVSLSETPLDAKLPWPHATIAENALRSARGAVEPEDIAVIVYTSGTTGQPKGAMLSHRAIVQTALGNLKWMKTGLDCTVCPAPINHVGALNNVCMTTFAGGGRIVFFPRVDLKALGDIAERERPSYLVASPTAFAMMLANPNADFARLDYYKLIVFGGASSPVAYLREVAKTGARMSSVYGQTETTGMMTYNPEGSSLDAMAETIGQAIPGAFIRIGDETGTPSAPGEIGEIQVSGAPVMTGYFNKPEATREAFTADGWLRTGDLGVERPDGNIAFAGRLKEMFKSGGYNVYPVEVELAICEHPEVAQAAVIAVDHPVFQEVGHGFLMMAPGATATPDDIKSFLRKRIADYKIPKSWSIEPTFPFLPNGKVDKRALKATFTA
jgi:acyl-CoA synthetase (AMP-forming)/AMP-acid ligase II